MEVREEVGVEEKEDEEEEEEEEEEVEEEVGSCFTLFKGGNGRLAALRLLLFLRPLLDGGHLLGSGSSRDSRVLECGLTWLHKT